jgi:hypothetical protein
MKKVATLLILIIMLTGCDDGDLTVDELNFDNAVAQRCGNLVFKIDGSDVLIIDLPDPSAFANEPTGDGQPLSFPINTVNRVLFRSYNAPVSAATFCGTLPPATPTVTEEWIANAGTIEITTRAITIPNTALPGGQKIDKYRHTITFRNINFTKPGGTQLYQTFNFGDFDTAATALPFNFNGTLDQCSDGVLYDFVGPSGILMNIDQNLLLSQVTSAGEPRVGLISASTNQVIYRLYESANGVLTDAHFCGSPPPSPALLQTWVAEEGVAGTSGIVQVTTTTNGTNFLHEIRLINVFMRKGNSVFKLADDYLLGQIITN